MIGAGLKIDKSTRKKYCQNFHKRIVGNRNQLFSDFFLLDCKLPYITVFENKMMIKTED
jgi:hypothetical protein